MRGGGRGGAQAHALPGQVNSTESIVSFAVLLSFVSNCSNTVMIMNMHVIIIIILSTPRIIDRQDSVIIMTVRAITIITRVFGHQICSLGSFNIDDAHLQNKGDTGKPCT